MAICDKMTLWTWILMDLKWSPYATEYMDQVLLILDYPKRPIIQPLSKFDAAHQKGQHDNHALHHRRDVLHILLISTFSPPSSPPPYPPSSPPHPPLSPPPSGGLEGLQALPPVLEGPVL